MANLSKSQLDVSNLLDVLNQMSESIVIFDKNFRYIFINSNGWEILGLPRKKVIGKNVWDLLPHLKGTNFEIIAKNSMNKMQPASIEEYYPHRQMWARTNFYPSKEILMVKIDDITELKNEQIINDQLMGDLQPAMEIYWSERNRALRESKPFNNAST